MNRTKSLPTHMCARPIEYDVALIRRSQENNKIVAKQFGVTHSNVSAIRLNKIWKHPSNVMVGSTTIVSNSSEQYFEIEWSSH